jgi:replication factor A3
MASEATPRVNATLLEQFANQTVRIVGKVTNLRGDSATLDAQGNITIILNRV